MKRFGLVCILTAMLAIGGCGGSGSGTGLTNPYRGSWTGTWASLTLGDSGTFVVTISPDGSVVGTMTITSLAATGTFVGACSGSGHFSGATGFGSNGNYTLTNGVFTLNGADLNGDCELTWQGHTYAATIVLAPTTG